MRRGSLATRIALLAAAVAVITAVIGGVLAFGLIRHADNRGARSTLARVATAVAADGQGPVRNRLALRAIKVSGGTIGRDGTVVASTRLARDALTQADVRAVLSGRPVSTEHHVDGSELLVEARPTTTGGIFVIQRRADAQAVTD
ncbi:MAG: hypothetical protein ACRDTP_07650, partial [Mycobacteriales bacterium]